MNVPPHNRSALRFDDDDDDVISSLRRVCSCLFVSCLLASRRLLRSVDDASCLELSVPGGLHLFSSMVVAPGSPRLLLDKGVRWCR